MYTGIVALGSVILMGRVGCEGCPLTICTFGNIFSHFGFHILRVMTGAWIGAGPRTRASSGVSLDFCTSDEIVSESHIFASTSK